MPTTLNPADAWQPLPPAAWDAEAARHLLRRTGWAARPEEVERVTREGLTATLERLFPATPPTLNPPAFFTAALPRLAELRRERRAATDATTRNLLDRDIRELDRSVLQELALHWLTTAADPTRSAYEKWVLCLADIFVVSYEKIQRADHLWTHHDIIRRLAVATAPELTKAISRSPAMIDYLDLNRSSNRAPNENFARELFELFVLGEGHYTEDDVKAAARAFTGYRAGGENGFRLDKRAHDRGEKTLFGTTGAFDGDAVIDLAYAQPAAAVFLPRELARFYLTDEALPPEFFAPLADQWRATGLSLRSLCLQFFGSTAFFDPAFRANFIKSPVHYLLGLGQDLGLDVIPLPRFTLQPLRQMGQALFYPPNVRGWVGGRLWINSSTLAARRQLAVTLCTPLDEDALNADDLLELTAARDAGRGRFTVDPARLEAFATLGAEGIADRLCDYFLPVRVPPAYRTALTTHFSALEATDFPTRVGEAVVAVLQSPEYQLC